MTERAFQVAAPDLEGTANQLHHDDRMYLLNLYDRLDNYKNNIISGEFDKYLAGYNGGFVTILQLMNFILKNEDKPAGRNISDRMAGHILGLFHNKPWFKNRLRKVRLGDTKNDPDDEKQLKEATRGGIKIMASENMMIALSKGSRCLESWLDDSGVDPSYGKCTFEINEES